MYENAIVFLKRKAGRIAWGLGLALMLGASSPAQTITTYSSLGAFTTALGSPSMTVEDFTSTDHFPISTGILNSVTNLPSISIFPGTIQPGVTYSTAIGSGNFFNIDRGASFTGGFLDTVTTGGPLTVTFAAPVTALGFDTSNFMGTLLAITINFSSGSPYTHTFPISGSTPVFYGFQSTAPNITSAVISGGTGTVTFALDNFRFTSVPEPDTLWLIGGGLAALAALRRRRQT